MKTKPPSSRLSIGCHLSLWLPALEEGTFSPYIRAYWGEQAIFDGSWKPPVVDETLEVIGK
ncbi:MAG: hypothetical protein QNJ72_26710 [Pleurocapsa sp. MO_226.B13]|nr:hypothetical protein [Pleurocapsa sp. MO_226.B13]